MNIFKDLSKYGSHDEENYLTESFVYLLRLICTENHTEGLNLLSKLFDVPILENIQTPALPIFSTQEMVESGIPDIAITLNSDLLAYIEIKHDAPLSIGQLEYYKGLLEKSEASHQALVLLTRSKQSAVETTLTADQYTHVCWYEVHAWLQDMLGLDTVVDHFINDFLVFLEEKKMSLQRVGWEYEKGISSLIDLTTMLEAALTEVFTDSPIAKAAGWYWRGFKLKSFYYVGVRFSDPNVIAFDDSYRSNPTFKRELKLEEKYFFSLKAGEQFECLLDFLREISNEPKIIEEETNSL